MPMKARYTVVNGEVIAQKRDGVRSEPVPDMLGSTVDMAQGKTDSRRSKRSAWFDCGRKRLIRRIFFIGVIAFCHYLLGYKIGSSPRFENSNDLDPIVNLLLFPMIFFFAVFPRMYGDVAWTLMIINSLIWGVGIYLAASGFNRVIRR